MALKSTNKNIAKTPARKAAAAKPAAAQAAAKPAVAQPLGKPAEAAAPVKPLPAKAAAKPAGVPAPVKATPAASPKPTPVEDKTRPVTFHYFAPQAQAVLLAGDFTQWESSPVRLQREDSGIWSATVKLTPGRHEYRLLVDGQWQNDPKCTELQPNQFGSTNCICAVSA